MRSRNSVYPLPQGAFSVHMNGEHIDVSSHEPYHSMETGLNRKERFPFAAILCPNIAQQSDKSNKKEIKTK